MAPELWRQPLPSDGVGGLAAAEGCVLIGGRDADDRQDLWLAFDAGSGQPRWNLQYPAEGHLDYGNSPRATPLLHDGLAYLQGALGHLTCADLVTGAILWQRNLATDFGTPPLDWGLAGSPLLHRGRLFVQPGGSRGSVVALDPLTGETLWTVGTAPPGHASLQIVYTTIGEQLLGYDKHSLGGWDPATGRRLWTWTPRLSGDFNVPMPLILEQRLLLTTENNSTRLYDRAADGRPSDTPLAEYEPLCPDAHSPVATAGRIFGVHQGLHCLDPAAGLAPVWVEESPPFQEYAALIASQNRLLCLTRDCQLILIDAAADSYRELSRLPLATDRQETLAHPALYDQRLYLRRGRELLCLDLAATAP